MRVLVLDVLALTLILCKGVSLRSVTFCEEDNPKYEGVNSKSILCERANCNFKGANPRSEGPNSRSM